ncbi:MAG: 1-deoxy-D-xylulose-5-phosphate reductoisomerase [Betaproteobacteria bacterium]|nr:1-deoxy-D-xylulose-5-phosphate reductoisomerase [Betaproteobacteria bacterium]
MRCEYGFGVFGATGTVGRAGLEAAGQLGIGVDVLAAAGNVEGMLQLYAQHHPRLIIMADDAAAAALAERLPAGAGCRVEHGDEAMCAAAAGCATMLAAVSGAAGLDSVLAAAGEGRRILLANKEALVLAGDHVLAAARAAGGQVVPVDSEHNALAELLLLAADRRDAIERVWLTASGGPFLNHPGDLEEVSPEAAVRHPVWSMGAKISVDSATMMNKGLEVIEACRLFSLTADQVEIVVHPQSVVHAIVEFADGGCLAQCAPADMRSTIARAIAWPEIPAVRFGRIDWRKLGSLQFQQPDNDRFPCLQLAYQALAAGGSAPAVLNAANEVAVHSFLRRELNFSAISKVVAETVAAEAGAADTLSDLVAADSKARAYAGRAIKVSSLC